VVGEGRREEVKNETLSVNDYEWIGGGERLVRKTDAFEP